MMENIGSRSKQYDSSVTALEDRAVIGDQFMRDTFKITKNMKNGVYHLDDSKTDLTVVETTDMSDDSTKVKKKKKLFTKRRAQNLPEIKKKKNSTQR